MLSASTYRSMMRSGSPFSSSAHARYASARRVRVRPRPPPSLRVHAHHVNSPEWGQLALLLTVESSSR